MDEIRKKVCQARRWLMFQQFLRVGAWSMFFGLLGALAAILLTRIWAFSFLLDEDRLAWWAWGWLVGGFVAGLFVAIVLVCLTRRNRLDAAIEVDRRFGLKERVSSVVAMDACDLKTPTGQALLKDTASRLSEVDVADRFHVKASWTALLPALPLTIAVLVVFFVRGATPEAIEAARAEQQLREQVAQSEDQFRKQVTRQKKQAEELGLKDAAKFLREIEQTYERQSKDEPAGRKQAMIRLNNIKKQAQQLRDKLAKSEEVRKRLNQLKDVKKGPADKAAKAIKDGDFKQAKDEVQKLAEKIRNDELGEQERKQLEKQLDSLQQRLSQHEQAKQELRDKIDEARRNGQTEKAEKLQDQLNRLAERDADMQQLEDVADKLRQASKNLKDGNREQAAKNLNDLASQLEDMQREMDQLETMDQLMDEISQAKNAMNCKQCQGKGCAECQGSGRKGQLAKAGGAGQQQGEGDPNARGLGEGQGAGDRPEQKTDAGVFDSKVGSNPKRGEVVRTGTAGGPNAAGRTRQEVKAAVVTSLSEDPEPVDGQPLPRAQREHAKQYFKLFREGGQ